MIVAIWRNWVERRQWWWLALLGCAAAVDLLAAGLVVKWQHDLFDLLLRLPFVEEGR